MKVEEIERRSTKTVFVKNQPNKNFEANWGGKLSVRRLGRYVIYERLLCLCCTVATFIFLRFCMLATCNQFVDRPIPHTNCALHLKSVSLNHALSATILWTSNLFDNDTPPLLNPSLKVMVVIEHALSSYIFQSCSLIPCTRNRSNWRFSFWLRL